MALRDGSRPVHRTESGKGDQGGRSPLGCEQRSDAGLLGRRRRGHQGMGNRRSLCGTARSGHHAIRTPRQECGRRQQGEDGTDYDPSHYLHAGSGPEGGAGQHGHPDYLLRPQRRDREACDLGRPGNGGGSRKHRGHRERRGHREW